MLPSYMSNHLEVNVDEDNYEDHVIYFCYSSVVCILLFVCICDKSFWHAGSDQVIKVETNLQELVRMSHNQ